MKSKYRIEIHVFKAQHLNDLILPNDVVYLSWACHRSKKRGVAGILQIPCFQGNVAGEMEGINSSTIVWQPPASFSFETVVATSRFDSASLTIHLNKKKKSSSKSKPFEEFPGESAVQVSDSSKQERRNKLAKARLKLNEFIDKGTVKEVHSLSAKSMPNATLMLSVSMERIESEDEDGDMSETPLASDTESASDFESEPESEPESEGETEPESDSEPNRTGSMRKKKPKKRPLLRRLSFSSSQRISHIPTKKMSQNEVKSYVKKKQQIKIYCTFRIELVSLSGLPPSFSNKRFFLTYRCGSKKQNQGYTLLSSYLNPQTTSVTWAHNTGNQQGASTGLAQSGSLIPKRRDTSFTSPKRNQSSNCIPNLSNSSPNTSPRSSSHSASMISDAITIQCSIHQDVKTQKFLEKNLALSLKSEENDSYNETVGSLLVNLANFANKNTEEVKQFPISLGNGSVALTLKISGTGVSKPNSSTSTTSTKWFGSTLESTLLGDDSKRKYCIPPLIDHLIHMLYVNQAPEVEGIFRLASNFSELAAIKQALRDGQSLDSVLPPSTNVHSLAALLKLFFRELPESVIFPYLTFLQLFYPTDQPDSLAQLKQQLHQLPPANQALLKEVCCFLNKIAANSAINRMTASNLAVVFGPCFLFPSSNAPVDPTTQLSHSPAIGALVQHLIADYDFLFEGEIDFRDGEKYNQTITNSLCPSIGTDSKQNNQTEQKKGEQTETLLKQQPIQQQTQQPIQQPTQQPTQATQIPQQSESNNNSLAQQNIVKAENQTIPSVSPIVQTNETNKLEESSKKIQQLQSQLKHYEILQIHIYHVTYPSYSSPASLKLTNKCPHTNVGELIKVLQPIYVEKNHQDTQLLSKIITAILAICKGSSHNNKIVVYWLSVSAWLLNELQQRTKSNCIIQFTGQIKVDPLNPTLENSSSSNTEEDISNHPFLIKNLIMNIYFILLDNIKASLALFVAELLDTANSQAEASVSVNFVGKMLGFQNEAPTITNKMSSKKITPMLSKLLQLLVQSQLFLPIIRQIFCGIFHSLNAFLFNRMLQQAENCTPQRAGVVKRYLLQIDTWLSTLPVEPAVRSAVNEAFNLELVQTRQLVTFVEKLINCSYVSMELINSSLSSLNIKQIQFLIDLLSQKRNVNVPLLRITRELKSSIDKKCQHSTAVDLPIMLPS